MLEERPREIGTRGVNGPFAALPTEICHFIMEYADKASKDALAQCSRHSYSITFPFRFNRIKLSEVNHRPWLNSFTHGWLAPLVRWIRAVALDIADLRFLKSLPAELTVFPNLQSLKFSLHAPKPFEGNLFTTLITSLSQLPYFQNLTHLSLNFYGYVTQFEPGDILIMGTVQSSFADQQELKKEEIAAHKYERALRFFPSDMTRDILGDYLSKVQVIEKTLSGEIYYPKKLQSLELGMGSHQPYYLTPVLNCPAITTIYFDYSPSLLRDSKNLTPMLQFLSVKNLVIEHVARFPSPVVIANLFPNVTSITITKHYMIYWSEFVTLLPRVRDFIFPWPRVSCRYAGTDFMDVGMRSLIAGMDNMRYPNITFRGSYDSEEGYHKEISASCTVVVDKSGQWDVKWEGDVDFDPKDMKLADFEIEMLDRRILDSDDSDIWGEEDRGSVYSEYIETEEDGGPVHGSAEADDADSGDYRDFDDEYGDGDWDDDSEYWESEEDEAMDLIA
ncbi:hypothetical protein TWF730_007018 [Orbilia blumenaviensis]|uniref:F-box domain-containing protein n=1 Tax=Orbilia blumenaviensis TaxID=1796055 RepID=A0AAV9VIE6_9PEZI